jgi:hypothetical protein
MRKKNLDLICGKKRLEDYDQMLQYYILMRIKSKMKDFDVESKEWWEVTKEYFSKELEKDLSNIKLIKERRGTRWRYIREPSFRFCV